MPGRVYLESVRDPGFSLSVTRLGKLRIVNRATFVEWLERQNAETVSIEPDDGDNASNGICEILENVHAVHTSGDKEVDDAVGKWHEEIVWQGEGSDNAA